MERDGSGDYVCCHARKVLKIFILVCFVTVLFVSSNGVMFTESSVGLKTPTVYNRRVHLGHQHLIYVSKRKVPNGPDPIHNRRVGESRRPPGRA